MKILFLLVFILLIRANSGVAHGPSFDQYETISEWILKFNIFDQQKCFVINFGLNKELPIPQIMMTLDLDIQQNVDINNLEAPSNCYFVIVGGEFLDVLEDVVEKISRLTHDLAAQPFMIILETDHVNSLPILTVDHLLPMVQQSTVSNF